MQTEKQNRKIESSCSVVCNFMIIKRLWNLSHGRRWAKILSFIIFFSIVPLDW